MTKTDHKRSKSNKWPFLAFFAGIGFVFLFAVLDTEVISPLILPADPCYYHTNPTPFWVELLYMHGGSNGHPEGNFTHLILLLLLGFISGHFFVRTIRVMKNKLTQHSEIIDNETEAR